MASFTLPKKTTTQDPRYAPGAGTQGGSQLSVGDQASLDWTMARNDPNASTMDILSMGSSPGLAAANVKLGQPTPWWQGPGMDGALENLTQSAPAGYEYDPILMKYTRTPTSVGQRAGQALGAFSGGAGGTGGGSSAGVFGSGMAPSLSAMSGGSGGSFGGGTVGRVQAPDNSAANAATFSRAKDQVGKTSRASLTSMQDEMGAQGMLGSGAAVQGMRDVTQGAAGAINDVSREQAVTDSSQKADFAKMGYQGDITQRGQDIEDRASQSRIALQRELAQQELLKTALAGLAQQY